MVVFAKVLIAKKVLYMFSMFMLCLFKFLYCVCVSFYIVPLCRLFIVIYGIDYESLKKNFVSKLRRYNKLTNFKSNSNKRIIMPVRKFSNLVWFTCVATNIQTRAVRNLFFCRGVETLGERISIQTPPRDSLVGFKNFWYFY